MFPVKGFNFFLIIFFSSSTFLFAQQPLKPAQLKAHAEVAVKIGDYYSAIDYYSKYLEQKSSDEEAQYMLAEMYRASRDYKKAETAYINAYDGSHTNNKMALFYYAQMLKQNGKYDLAKKNFKEFLESVSSLKDSKKYKKLAEIEIEGCDMASDLSKPTPLMRVIHLDSSINKANTESSPILVNDTMMMFASIRADTITYIKGEDDEKKLPKKKFYVAFKEYESWKGSERLSGYFNAGDYHTANGIYSLDGKRFYFTRCKKDLNTNKLHCSIWISYRQGGHFNEPIELTINDKKYNSTQPALGPDPKNVNNEVLYFFSVRPVVFRIRWSPAFFPAEVPVSA